MGIKFFLFSDFLLYAATFFTFFLGVGLTFVFFLEEVLGKGGFVGGSVGEESFIR